jgi:hypothetical protein
MRTKTWHLEASFDAALLGAVVVLTTPTDASAWLGALAVWLATRHASVADRLREAEELRQHTERVIPVGALALPIVRPAGGVSCLRWLDRYLVAKELCWILYFALLGAWPALVGALRFLVYPYWRRWYRRRWPLGR